MSQAVPGQRTPWVFVQAAIVAEHIWSPDVPVCKCLWCPVTEERRCANRKRLLLQCPGHDPQKWYQDIPAVTQVLGSQEISLDYLGIIQWGTCFLCLGHGWSLIEFNLGMNDLAFFLLSWFSGCRSRLLEFWFSSQVLGKLYRSAFIPFSGGGEEWSGVLKGFDIKKARKAFCSFLDSHFELTMVLYRLSQHSGRNKPNILAVFVVNVSVYGHLAVFVCFAEPTSKPLLTNEVQVR